MKRRSRRIERPGGLGSQEVRAALAEKKQPGLEGAEAWRSANTKAAGGAKAGSDTDAVWERVLSPHKYGLNYSK